MSKPKSHKENLVIWRTMLDNLAARLDEMPQITREQHAEFSVFLARAEKLEAQQSRYKAKLQEVNRERAAAALQGRRMRNRLADGLKGFFDVDNPQLLAFGVPPRRPPGQRRHRLTKDEKAARAAAAAAERSGDPSPVD
jgi:hypothetical protein